MSAFHIKFEELPDTLGVLPLPGLMLLPGCYLPLNIFESRYISLIEDALANRRILALGQPCEVSYNGTGSQEKIPTDAQLYKIITAARLALFEETEDGRFQVHLKGLCRGVLEEEIITDSGFRKFNINWQKFEHDLEVLGQPFLNREIFFDVLKRFFDSHQIRTDWDSLRVASDEKLIALLAMAIDFDPAEKQALLEAKNWIERSEVLIALMEMSLRSGPNHRIYKQ